MRFYARGRDHLGQTESSIKQDRDQVMSATYDALEPREPKDRKLNLFAATWRVLREAAAATAYAPRRLPGCQKGLVVRRRACHGLSKFVGAAIYVGWL